MTTIQAISFITAPTREEFTNGMKSVLDEPNSRIITISHHVAVQGDVIQYSAVILREVTKEEK